MKILSTMLPYYGFTADEGMLRSILRWLQMQIACCGVPSRLKEV